MSHREGAILRTCSVESSPTNTLDTRGVAAAARDALILSSFRRLGVGESMLLVHGRDPNDMFSQLRAAMPGSFTWLCMEAGPKVWRVKIGRLATW